MVTEPYTEYSHHLSLGHKEPTRLLAWNWYEPETKFRELGLSFNSKILKILGANRLPIVKFQLPEHIFRLYRLPTGPCYNKYVNSPNVI
jgi:hypothetical protein